MLRVPPVALAAILDKSRHPLAECDLSHSSSFSPDVDVLSGIDVPVTSSMDAVAVASDCSRYGWYERRRQ